MQIQKFIQNFTVLTEEQRQTINELDESLTTIMTNPGGHFYDFMDVKKYKELLSSQNKKFKKAFPLSRGLYTCQVDHYHLQMFMENEYRHPVEGIFSFRFTPEVFQCAYMHELAIHTYIDHKAKDSISLYHIQLKAMAVWLLVVYFDIKNFKQSDFEEAFTIMEDCLDEDISTIEKA